jgi:23S rRNA pseudouridine1911/1915/1917 synthase
VPMTVRYEDESLLVVDKPAGVVTHPSAGHATGTLVHGLLAHAIAGGSDPTRPGIVHRLDRDTSGLLVVARSERAHRRLQRMLRNHEIERIYIALTHGAMPPALTVDRPIGRDRRVRTRQAIDPVDGRAAVTHLRLLEALGRFSLVEARLETGRTHQIRVHLEAVGHPVVGDRVYGRREETLGLERQFLHAARLAFAHPETGEPVEVESPLPHELSMALDRARARDR